ncbi:MAG TPA: hypothetical protein VJ716_02780 [Gaiellaceae bacterium]|nr:hypothetical protein [Gaiellaceae bacterium]
MTRFLLVMALVAGSLLAAGAPGAAAASDSISIALSSTGPATGVPINAVFSTTSAPIDSFGDGPYLYAVAQPASAGACQPTFGDDEQVVGSQATTLGEDEVSTGADSTPYSYAAYAAGAYTICAWLETVSDDGPDSGYTPSVVTATASASLTAVNTDAVSASLSTGSPEPHIPFTVVLASNATPIDAFGDGPYLYAVVQPASAGSCQPTFGADQQVVGSRAVLLGNSDGAEVNTGKDTSSASFTAGAAGSYAICAWLESVSDDGADSGYTPSVVTAKTSKSFTVLGPPPACIVPKVRRGRSLLVAERAITAHHCTVGRIRHKFNRRVKKGKVIALTQKAGTHYPRGHRVGILVSRGKRRS